MSRPVSDIVMGMINASIDSVAELRAKVSDVKWGPVESNHDTIFFSLDGVRYRGRLTGRNADWLVCGDGRESDKALAIRVLLDKCAQPISMEVAQ